MIRLLVPAAMLAALAGCVDTDMEDMSASTAAPDRQTPAQMPVFCRGEAAALYGGPPQYITTLPAEPDQGMYTVPGYTENQEDFFTCTFTADGEFVGIDPA